MMTAAPTRLMGIVNVTPDSFADNVHRSVTDAIDWGVELVGQGADLIDVGGESTRPDATRVDPEDEAARVLPVIEALAGAGITISVDTVHSSVAAAAVRAGAHFVNDVSGGLADDQMWSVVANSSAHYILQHWRTPFSHRPTHEAVVSEVADELWERAQSAIEAGIDPDRLILDPGIGFGKTASQNWELIAHAQVVSDLGFPVLWGVSRKRFLAQAYAHPTQPWQRDAAGASITGLLARQRVWAVRAHTAPEHKAAIAVAELIRAEA
ncbi:MAG: dihydropteroate synthase [Propionibacteriaceae bacterium]|jgi:dihydropteroate synthase|nr:dihydropteroate synthase [Propionibacteriaceae bacterium]